MEQSHEVKAKVETCADDLATANEIVKEQIAGGTTLLSAHETLLAGTSVESKVQECADDLHEVTETLAQGIDDLAQTEIALTESTGNPRGYAGGPGDFPAGRKRRPATGLARLQDRAAQS